MPSSAFDQFVEAELPLRPAAPVDGAQGYVLVRQGAGARQVAFVDPLTLPGGGGGGDPELRTLTAENDISGHRVVRILPDGNVDIADSANMADMGYVLGITLGAVTAGNSIQVRVAGILDEPSWAWTVDQPVFLSSSGLLTQAEPVTGFSLVIGWAQTPTRLFVSMNQPIWRT